MRFVFDISLYYGHNPSGIHFLEQKVLANIVVPEIALVASFPNALARALTPQLSRSLSVRSQVTVVGKVKARKQQFFHPFKVVFYLIDLALIILEKRNKVHVFD